MYTYLCRERERNYFNELARVITEAGKSKMCKVGQQAGDPSKSTDSAVQGRLLAEFLLAQGKSVFLLYACLQLNG